MAAFCVRMDHNYDQAPHTKKICEVLDALAAGEIQNAMMFMPPRHGKTYHVSERFPAYFQGRNGGDKQIILASYTIDRARASSRIARTLFREDTWPFPNVKLDPESQSVDDWRTESGGILKASGVGGSMTGFGAHLLVIDDPVKDREEADSANAREKNWSWYTEVARTRLMRGGRQLLCMTRWHDDDLAGRLLNSKDAKNWDLLTLPLYALENDALGRSEGELLWPEGELPIPSVAEGTISSRGFEALYMQRPQPDDGSIFRAGWMLNRYDTEPPAKRGCMFVDGAWKEGIANDRSAIAVWSTDSINYHLRHAWGARVEYPDLKQKVLDIYAAWKPRVPNLTLCVEDAASGMALVQELKRSTNIPVIGVPAKGSKEARAEAITPLFESGKAFLPREAEWLDVWIDEHLRFPAGKHDDFVDTTSGALARLSENKGPIAIRVW